MASVADCKTFHPIKSKDLLRVFEPAHCSLPVADRAGQ